MHDAAAGDFEEDLELMVCEYAQKRLTLFKWIFGTLLVMAIVAAPIFTMEVLKGERAIWELAIAPIGILVFAFPYMRVRKMSRQVGPALSVTGEGIMIRELGVKPIPWTGIARISSFGVWIVLSLKEGEIEQLELGKLALRIRRIGPFKDNSVVLSLALYSVSEAVLRDEIEKHASAKCGEAIRLHL
ncbi:hypothetical protein [Roseibium sp.]|uniref:hypothetical protein n=1 Tax=Roseibium sp. TaxID=1936156 RepID=UPI003B5047D8